jgi:hypothetical protein
MSCPLLLLFCRSLCKAARDASPQLITTLHLCQEDMYDDATDESTGVAPEKLPWRLFMSLTHIEEMQFEGCSTATHILLQTHNASTLKKVRFLIRALQATLDLTPHELREYL